MKIIMQIYIPLWLDLLSTGLPFQQLGEPNLHSTMVRFIIIYFPFSSSFIKPFTFHYG